MICDECETVAHCLKNGCVPKQPSKDEALKLALETLEYTTTMSKFLLSKDANIGPILKAEKAITAIKQALSDATPLAAQPAPVQEPVWCGNCNGSGRMVRDPDIGTDQECFVCDGAGVPSAPVQQSRSDVEPVAWMWEQRAARSSSGIGGWDKLILFCKPVDDPFVEKRNLAPLYTTPPAQPLLKPLTKDQITKFYGGDSPLVFQIIREVEAHHGIKEKNT